MSPRRVLHVVNNAEIGGIERLVLDLLVLQKSDPELAVSVLFLQSDKGGFGPAFRALGVPLHCLNLTSGRDLSPAKFRHAVALLRDMDVIHIHVFNALLALAAMRAGRPVVLTVHGVLGHGRRMRWSDRVNDMLLRWYLNHRADLVTYNSHATEALARQRYGLEHVRGDVIYNGIARLQPSESRVDAATAAEIEGRFVVGTSTRFAHFKRIDRLIDGFAVFARRYPEARLLLVGDGVLRGELEAQVELLGISSQTVFTGFRSDVRAYQQAMSVCVFPSVAEPFGLVAVEALALGKPVVVFADGGGMVEVVSPCGGTDVVASIDELAQRLEFYHEHRDELARGAPARRAHAETFDIARTADQFRRHYLAFEPCAA